MKPHASFFLLISILAGLLAACGGATPAASPPAAGGTAATAAPAAAAGGEGGTIKIVSSLPRTGSSKGQSDTVVNAINQRLKQDNSQACNGQFKINYEDMDDATAAAGKWDPTQEANNANKAAADADVMVYIGTFNSGAAKVSIPILRLPSATTAAWCQPTTSKARPRPTGPRILV
jgi:branched-chain amino acid transport system substrate-binding protein